MQHAVLYVGGFKVRAWGPAGRYCGSWRRK